MTYLYIWVGVALIMFAVSLVVDYFQYDEPIGGYEAGDMAIQSLMWPFGLVYGVYMMYVWYYRREPK